ncbi:transcriptional regulator, DeoR family [Providencia alcalifaciens DSM 30120]|uniref:Transcriptional regulator, DeoR family n=1 Tax=Providencia alcalifaciens DSM 30120 TaxID=520999 RepID=B6XDB7_9GAMM|nr:transcriptional regulator, DeoR family [Providencia alcalifaciens DSM 30120]
MTTKQRGAVRPRHHKKDCRVIETKQKERLRRLSECIKRSGRIHLKEAARILEVSEMTIRRDLNADTEGPIPMSLLGGYIVSVTQPAALTPHEPHADIFTPDQTEDLYIPNLAASMVSEDDVIFFDNGIEMATLIALIPEEISFTGICYSHNVFLALSQKKNATALLCGGEYRPKSDSFYSPTLPSLLDSINPKKAFMSATGVHSAYGVTCYNLDDLPMKKKGMEKSIRKILLAPYNLFDEVATANMGELSQFDVIVTNRQLSDEYETYCRNGFVKVIY